MSILETIDRLADMGFRLEHSYKDQNRIGDHIWYISDVRRFQAHYPNWKYQYGLNDILKEIHAACGG